MVPTNHFFEFTIANYMPLAFRKCISQVWCNSSPKSHSPRNCARYDPPKMCLYENYHQDRVNGCSIPTCLFKMVQNPGEELYSKLESIKSPSHTRGLTISKEKKMAPPLVFRTKTQMQLHELALILSFIDRFTSNTHII